jgi:hypothetical protein
VHEDKGKKWEEVLSDLLKKIKKRKWAAFTINTN